MSGKMNQSLDEILSSQRRNATRGRAAQRRSSGRPSKAAPVGGVQKTAKPARGTAGKPAPTRATGTIGDSKIVVSNLPKDVSEAQIKDFFSSSVGHVKKVELSYGPGGVSRGIATVIFGHADSATKAFGEMNGILIDNRPVKVEVVVANAALIPAPKTLSQRMSQPKVQPKSAAANKHAGNNAKGGAAGNKPAKKARTGRSARPAKKTAEELDSEMADYFDGSAAGANGAAPAAPAATAGDAAMDDEIM